MRTLVHLSDIHFGRVNYATVQPLLDFVRELRPDLVAISGDLTQRARPAEFREARAFLDALPLPQVVVPGNHDVPLYNVYARFHQPLRRYREYIQANPEPEFADSEIAVLGLNSARSLVFKGGRINVAQVARIRNWLCAFDPGLSKILVTHHPFDLPPGSKENLLVGRARMVMRRMVDCGPVLFLSGHLHLAHLGLSVSRYPDAQARALIVQAGTATSTRGRGEANSFNVLRIENADVRIERIAWNTGTQSFRVSGEFHFRRTDSGWEKV